MDINPFPASLSQARIIALFKSCIRIPGEYTAKNAQGLPMLVERQLSVFLVGVFAAITIPEIYPVYAKQAPVTDCSHFGLLIGAMLGALGVLLGVLLAPG